MRRLVAVWWLVLVVTLTVGSTASAKDLSGRFGLGFDKSLGGVHGLSIRYQTSKTFGIQTIVGIGFGIQNNGTTDANGEPADKTETITSFAMRGDLNIAYTSDVNLSIPFGFDLFIFSTDDQGHIDDDNDIQTQINLEVGLKIEWFITDFLSIHCEGGIVIYIIPDNGIPKNAESGALGTDSNAKPDGDGALEFNIIHPTDLLGTAGITFWFP